MVGQDREPPSASGVTTRTGKRLVYMVRENKKTIEYAASPEEGAKVIDEPFIAAVAERQPSPVSVQSARRTSAVVLAAIESIKTGQAVDLTAAPWAGAM